MSSKSSTNTGETPQGENPASQVPVEPATDPAAGFQRGRIVWGRPPQPVFRAGPLPRDEGLARLMAMPPHPQATKPTVKGSVATGVTGGGNIPQAARAPNAPQGAPQSAGGASRGVGGGFGGFSNVPQRPATPTPAARPVPQAGVLGGSLVPAAKPAVVPAAAPETAPAKPADKVPPQIEDDIVVMSELEPVVAPRRPRQDAPVSAAAPALDKTRTNSSPAWGKWAVAGGALLVAAGALFWWMNREPAVPAVAPATPPVTSAAVAPVSVAPDVAVEAVPDAAPAPVDAIQTAPAVAAPASRTAPERGRPSVPTTTQAPTSAPRTALAQSAPVPVAQPVAPPVVVQVPAEAPASEQAPRPTVAAPVEANPDAPVVTRPQKLD